MRRVGDFYSAVIRCPEFTGSKAAFAELKSPLTLPALYMVHLAY